MQPYGPYRRSPRQQSTRTLTIDQIKQIEATLQELESEATKWKELARKWEATAKEEHERADHLEGQVEEQQEVIAQIQEKAAQVHPEVALEDEMDDAERESIQEMEDQITQMETHLIQAQAEYENARKRLEKRYADLLDQNIMEFLRDLLPVLDNLDRAIEHAPEDADNEGIRLTRQMFLSTLDKYGVKPIEALGFPFDPEVHEALGTIENQSLKPGTVSAVAEPGFTYREKLLRPARVLVTPEV
ncbi:MAG: nucleotide exchange factor GrpE [Anaerolineales bacterium]